MEEYKGIYYGDDKEKKFFEGGAHFKYIQLYQRLEQLSSEQKIKENGKGLYINKKNKLKNLLNYNNMNYFDNTSKKKKSRNILGYFNDNMTSNSIINYSKNKSYNNNAFTECNKNNGNYNDKLMNNKINYHQTYIMMKNNKKDNSYQNTNSIAIKNQKKIIISRNKAPSIILKGRPKTIMKEGAIQNLLFIRKNNIISNSILQRKSNKKLLIETLNKRSFPNINNISNGNIHKKIKANESYNEINKSKYKIERNKIDQVEKWNKSQSNFSQIKIRLNSANIKNTRNKIKKKNYIMNENKKIKERTKSNLTNFIYKNIIEQCSYKKEKEKENEEKKEAIIKKLNKKKNMNNEHKIFVLSNNNNNTSTIKSKINLNNQIQKIIYNPNISQNIDKKISLNLNKLPFNGKSRNINVCINEINNSFNIKSNQNIKSRNKAIINTSRNINNEKFKTSFKIMLEKGKIPNMKQNNKIIQPKNKINKYSPKINKRINKNPIMSNSNLNSDNKNMNYNYVLDNFRIDKEKILQNISASNNLSELRNKTLNINIINNTCIYIKPKKSKIFPKNQSRNERTSNDIMPINYTQRPIMRKKKAIIKFAK